MVPSYAGTHIADTKCVDGDFTHYCDNLGRLLLSISSDVAATIDPEDVNVMITPGTRYYAKDCIGAGGSEDGNCFISNDDGAIILCRTWDVDSPELNAGVRYYFDDTDIDIVQNGTAELGLNPFTNIEQMWFYKVKNGQGHAKPEDLTVADIDLIDNNGTGIPSIDNWVLGNTAIAGTYYAEYMVSSFSGGGGGAAEKGGSPVCPNIEGEISGSVTLQNPGSTNLTVDINGGDGPYQVILSDGTSINNYSSGDAISVSITETTPFTIQTIIDSNGCPHSVLNGTATVYLRSATDDIPPLALCNDVSIALDTFGMASIEIEDVDNGSFDNLNQPIASITLDQSFFICEDGNSNIVTLTVTDLSGNSAECTSTVTISDPTNSCCPGVKNISVVPNGIKNYNGSIINSDAVIKNANNNTDIKFNGVNSINLNNGFEVIEGALFEANISPCNWP